MSFIFWGFNNLCIGWKPSRRAALSGTQSEVRIPTRLLGRRQRIRRLASGISSGQINSLIELACARSPVLRYCAEGAGSVLRSSPLPETRRLVVKALDGLAARARPGTYTVMSYNVLADHLAAPRLFPYVDPKYLDWAYRSAIIRREIRSYRPALLCLQAGFCLLLDRELPARRCSQIPTPQKRTSNSNSSRNLHRTQSVPTAHDRPSVGGARI